MDTDTRQAGAEIEITKEMIKEGLRALGGVAFPLWEDEDEVIARAYVAMERERLRCR